MRCIMHSDWGGSEAFALASFLKGLSLCISREGIEDKLAKACYYAGPVGLHLPGSSTAVFCV